MNFYNKVFKFIYPYKHLHSKWWHRLVLVITIVSTIGLAGLTFVTLEDYDLRLGNEAIDVTVMGSNGFGPVEACNKTESLLSYNRYDGCNDEHVFDYLIETKWGNEVAIFEDGGSLSSASLKDSYFRSSERALIADLVNANFIEVQEYSWFSFGNLILLILISIVTAALGFSVFFGVVYRIILYISYGKSLGRK